MFSILLSFSSFVIADDSKSPPSTTVTYVGKNQTAEYTITVPASLAPSDSGTVKLTGSWPSDMIINVTSDQTVTLTNSIDTTNSKTLNVGFTGISQQGNNIKSIEVSKDITVANFENAPLFGNWNGTIKYYVTSETIVESTISSIWSKDSDMVLKGSITEVQFDFSSNSADTKIVSVSSDDESVVKIVEVPNLMSMNYQSTETYYVEAVGKGTATITAKLDTDEETALEVNVYELSIEENSKIESVSDNLEVGDTVKTGDIEIDIPVTNPDGSEGSIKVKPEIPEDTVLQNGENEIQGKAVIDGVEVEVTIIVIVEDPNMATVKYIAGDNGSVSEESRTFEKGSKLTFPGTIPANEFVFSKWVDFSNGEDGATVNTATIVESKMVVKAIFREMTDLEKAQKEATAKGYTVVAYEDGLEIKGFSNPNNVTKITIPSKFGNLKVLSIGSSAFRTISPSIYTSITIPNSIKNIDSFAFSDCKCLTSISIPGSVKTIGQGAFENCSGAKSITINSGVKTIGFCAFWGCTGVTSITIPSSVTYIESMAFQNVLKIVNNSSYKDGSPWGAKSGG